jgi:hypothetical protein
VYEIGACTESVGYVNNSWSYFNASTVYLEDSSSCHQAPVYGLSPNLANLAVGDVLGVGDPPVGEEAGWRFTAPPGTKISEVRGSDDLFKDNNNDWNVYLEDGSGSVLGGQTCSVDAQASYYCEVAGVFHEPGINASSLRIGVKCTLNSANNCPDGATVHDVRAELDEAVVTINDPVAPTDVTGEVPSGPQHGTISISGAATDMAAGLLSLSVVNSSNEVIGGPVAAPGTCDYSFVTPCPTKAEGLSIPIDTTKLPNGQNEVRVEATNAAQDEGFSTAYMLEVENVAPKESGGGASGGGETTSGEGSGSKASSGGGAGAVQGGTSSSSPLIMPVATSPLETIAIYATSRRSRDGGLLLSGRVSGGVTGLISISVEARRGALHRWRRHVSVAIGHGRFQTRIRLPRGLRRRRVVVRLIYPGNDLYKRASRVLFLGGSRRL